MVTDTRLRLSAVIGTAAVDELLLERVEESLGNAINALFGEATQP